MVPLTLLMKSFTLRLPRWPVMKMKRTLGMSLALVIAAGVTACGSSSKAPGVEQAPSGGATQASIPTTPKPPPALSKKPIVTVPNTAAPTKLVLNLAEVPYMDSSAIAVFVETLQKLRKAGGKLYLTNLQPRVKGLLEIARLDSIFVICADEKEAMTK